MDQENNPQEITDTGIISYLRKLFKSINGEENLTDEQVEACRSDFWKCPKCGDMNKLSEFYCRKCSTSRPAKHEHPGKEEIIKYIKKGNQSIPFWAGLASFICFAAILITGYILDHQRGTFPDLLTVVFAGFFGLSGVILIIYGLYRKVKGN